MRKIVGASPASLASLLLSFLLFVSSVAAQDSTPTSVPAGATTYTVVRGDNLYNIALRFGTTVEAIVEANDIPNMSRILVGTVLIIPEPPTPTPTPTEAPFVVLPAETETPIAVLPAEQASSATEEPIVVLPAQTDETSVEVLPAATEEPSIGLPFDLGGEVFGAIDPQTLNNAGMTWVKVALQWNVGDPLDTIERVIQQAHDAGFKVLLQISGSPDALAADGARYQRRFAEHLGEIAALAPEAIEVWGGMNTATSITPQDYAQLMAAAFQSIKIANPNVLVVTGALSEVAAGQCSTESCDDLSYLRGMAAAGVSQYADCIGVNYTLGALPPDVITGDLRGDQFVYYYPALVAVYANIFPDKALCFTRIGYLVFGGTPPDATYSWAQNNTAQNRAQWLAQALLLARQSGRVLLFTVYNVNATVNLPDNPQADYAIVGADGSCLACLTLSTSMRLQ